MKTNILLFYKVILVIPIDEILLFYDCLKYWWMCDVISKDFHTCGSWYDFVVTVSTSNEPLKILQLLFLFILTSMHYFVLEEK